VVPLLRYHDREPPKREGLRELVLASVRTDERRQEMEAMARTIADELRDEGRREGEVQGHQQTLLLVLSARFKRVPKAVERTVNATEDVTRLENWLRRAATADALSEVGIETGS
jgi:hypothetical protein